MSNRRDLDPRAMRFVFLTVAVVALAAVFVAVGFRSQAGDKTRGQKGLLQKTESHQPGLENYDIRNDKRASGEIANIRSRKGKSAAQVAELRDRFASGEKKLATKVRNLQVEYSADLRAPEVISVDVRKGGGMLTAPLQGNRAERLREFARANKDLFGLGDSELNTLKVTADYQNPEGGLSFASLEQKINGVPVFRGEIKAGFTQKGEIIRIINNLAPGLENASITGDFGDPAQAVTKAFNHINAFPTKLDAEVNAPLSNDLKTVFGTGEWATSAEKMYFPTEPGVVVPSWRVLIWQPVNAYYVIVDAETGAMLWRKNITEDQTQSATYGVYRNPNAAIDVADNPFPLTPGPAARSGQQGAAIGRTSVSRIGNEGVYSFNNLGWITDGTTKTDGNNVQAGIDRDGTNGVDTNGEAQNATRQFAYTYSPFDPNTNTGDSPLPSQSPTPTPQPYPPTDYQQGITTQLFWISNWYHDELYRLGFTEAARNFQNDNFGRGGVGVDRVSAEAQDSSGTNNANFSTPADGGRGRMQMYLWSFGLPGDSAASIRIDGSLDADVVVHELTHGTSNRLHGNGSGLSTNMARGMGEGWSDFFAHCLLSEPSDPLLGIYTTGGYATYQLRATAVGGVYGTWNNNYYYGIRRFPKAVKAFVGSNGRPHNPFTFADIDSTQISVSDGAFAPAFTASAADQVHAAGEVWSTALWEVRGQLINRLGAEAGNRKAMQLVIDGMKLSPAGPTFLQARDSIIAAAQASSLADVADVWNGFALRGMGANAVVNNVGSGSGTARVTEAFDLPGVAQSGTFTVSDSIGDNDGYLEPGEPVRFTVALTNSYWDTASNVTLQIGSGTPVNYGTLAAGASGTQSFNYTLASSIPCGSSVNVTFNISSSIGQSSFTKTLIIGKPTITFQENFDAVTAPSFPAGWTANAVQSGINFVTSTNYADSAPNSAFALDPTTVGGGTDLISPPIQITSSAATVTFRHRYDTEGGWDGGVVEISLDNGTSYQDIITAGGRFVAGGYNGSLGTGTNNPLNGRSAWTGNSGGFVTTQIQLPAGAAGKAVYLKWRFGADDNGVGSSPNPGWYIDGTGVAGNYTCSYNPSGVKATADFDGDGKTDIGIFRPNGGSGGAEWWYLKSGGTSGDYGALGFGSSSDTAIPADYTGDGKADVAFFRPSTGQWYVVRSENSTFYAFPFGASGDVPAPADYDGDGKADAAVFRPSSGIWYVLKSSDGLVQVTSFGLSGDKPIPADFDGDGKADIALFRSSGGSGGAEWWLYRSTAGIIGYAFGASTDKPVIGDYTGDGKADIALFRPSNSSWYVIRSNDNSFYAFPFGISTDAPAPGDYDGDGKTDPAVFRTGQWYILRSSDSSVGATPFGNSTDKPVPGILIQ